MKRLAEYIAMPPGEATQSISTDAYAFANRCLDKQLKELGYKGINDNSVPMGVYTENFALALSSALGRVSSMLGHAVVDLSIIHISEN
jgi:hypothetical protein